MSVCLSHHTASTYQAWAHLRYHHCISAIPAVSGLELVSTSGQWIKLNQTRLPQPSRPFIPYLHMILFLSRAPWLSRCWCIFTVLVAYLQPRYSLCRTTQHNSRIFITRSLLDSEAISPMYGEWMKIFKSICTKPPSQDPGVVYTIYALP